MRNCISTINELQKKYYVIGDPQIICQLNTLRTDIQSNFYTVVVIGEFSRGKSTFINALLGTPLLPMDILPETTTINAIIYSEEPRISVMTKSGEQIGELSSDFLKKFSAQAVDENYLRQIKYIKIGYPLDLLKNRIVLVDTPGISDLNQQREEITYSFIPKADTVIFMLDATSPLKKSEASFINERLVPLGITDILFLLNKYDHVDEEEDADLIENVKKRLSKAFNVNESGAGLKKFECLPISSLNALKGMQSGNSTLVKNSGIQEVKDKLTDMLSASRIESIKSASYRIRLKFILETLNKDLANRLAIKLADSDELQTVAEKLRQMLEEKARSKSNIATYMERNKQLIYEMTEKSLQHFYRKLDEEISDLIDGYNQDNFKEFVEKTITKNIRKNFETWINIYSPIIDRLLNQLENEISHGLSFYFNQNVRLSSRHSKNLQFGEFSIALKPDDVSDVNTKVGIVAAASSIGLMAILGGGILPLIGFAAVPLLRKKFLRERLDKAKAEIIPAVQEHLTRLTSQLNSELHRYIDNRCTMIVANAESFYETTLSDLTVRVQVEISNKNSAKSEIQQEIELLKRNIQEVDSFIQSI